MIYHFKIYQADSKDIAKHAYLFEPYRRVKDSFSIDNYKLVYEDDYHIDLENINMTYILEDLFKIFNIARPKDFKGHSLSVSDVIEINENKYYCDSFGFKKL